MTTPETKTVNGAHASYPVPQFDGKPSFDFNKLEIISAVRIDNFGQDPSSPDGVQRITMRSMDIVRNARYGQIVGIILCSQEDACGNVELTEKIPCSLETFNKETGEFTVIISPVGPSTKALCAIGHGNFTNPAGRKQNYVHCVSGPIGISPDIEDGNLIFVLGGYGTGVAIEVAKEALRIDANKKLSFIIGARRPENLILLKKLAEFGEVISITDEGKWPMNGRVTAPLEELLYTGENFGGIYAAGPWPMMAAVSEMAKSHEVTYWSSCDPNMKCMVGMCSTCQVDIGKEIKVACTQGPWFRGYEIDYKGYAARLDDSRIC